MLGSVVLDIGIGLIVVFVLVSTICTAIREGIESFLKTRAAHLEHGIRQLLNDETGTGLAKSLYDHPLVNGIFSGGYTPRAKSTKPGGLTSGNNLPSYINSKNFAQALMDIAARGTNISATNTTAGGPLISLDAIRSNVTSIQNEQIQRVILYAVNSAQGDINRAQKTLEDWFNSSMDRVSGWYKRSTQMIIFVVAIVVSFGMNINTIKIANYFSINDEARKMVVAEAETMTKAGSASSVTYDDAKKKLADLALPIGWGGDQPFFMVPGEGGWWNKLIGPVLGLLITAFAATLGAPFWFDMLNKVMVIRSTVKPHEKSPEEASEDRREPTPKVMYVSQPAVYGAQPQHTHEAAVAGEPDCCDIKPTSFTEDEDLPESKGGVA